MYYTPDSNMEASSSRKVEITVLSAENLRLDKKLVKKNTFVIVQTDPFNSHTTRTDTLGGGYPSWNEKLVFDLPVHAGYIYLEVQSKSSSGTRSIGVAKIPVSDFIGGYVPENYLHFLSYRLRDSKWEKNGIINVSVRVNTPGYVKSSPNTGKLKVTGYTSFSPQASDIKVKKGYGSCSWQLTRPNMQGHAPYSTTGTGPNEQRYASFSSQTRFGVPVGGVVTGVPVLGHKTCINII
ncbi:BON1-associated protein 2-like [Mangifera indica]|uniref:BON1-associated protein 2-like n=1 Tax=Mangifera indica TaxID=29780 RepID=UPI001CFA9625|nr:BON1-associated protein 2-like [Mangifera indica]